MPPLLKPTKGKLGLQDHEKVFCVDHKGAGDIFDMRGIDRERGCMVVVRPDQYIAHVLPLDGVAELAGVFRRVPAAGGVSPRWRDERRGTVGRHPAYGSGEGLREGWANSDRGSSLCNCYR